MESRQRKRKTTDGSSAAQAGNAGRRSWVLWVSLVAVIVVLVVGVIASHPELPGQSSVEQRADQNIAAPDFQLSVYQGADALPIDGEEGQFSELFQKNQPVVLNFWAGLCPPCRAEMPAFQQVYDEMGDQFVLVGLDIGPFVHLGSREDGRALLQELGITYPAATTFNQDIVNEYKIRGMPTTVFLTPDGEIFNTHTGLLNTESLRSEVQAVLQASDG